MIKSKLVKSLIRYYIFLFFMMVLNAANAYSDRIWVDPYLGINAGGFWGNSNLFTSDTNSLLLNFTGSNFDLSNTGSLNPTGFTSGIEGGYNLHFDAVLLGLELDFDSFSINKTRTVTQPYTSDEFSAYIQQQTVKADWLFTLRPRIGYQVDKTLLYFTGGLAVAQIKDQYSLFDGSTYILGSDDKSQTGWNLGGGVEYILKGRWGDHWTVKLEYLYVNFGTNVFSSIDTAAILGQTLGVGDTLSSSYSFNTNIIRAGVNYHF